MPFADVGALRASPLYAKMKQMHVWGEAQLQHFLSTFNAVFSKAKSEGAEDAEAESLSIAIATGSAKRLAQASMVASLETTRHYFVPMWHHQLGRTETSAPSGASFSFRAMKKYWEPLRAALAGITFNHEHNQASPVGVIHDILTAEQVAAMGIAVSPDAPFVMVASYVKGLGPAVRDEHRISSEWLEVLASDGKIEAIPLSFAITDTPLNGEVLGVRRIASLEMNQTSTTAQGVTITVDADATAASTTAENSTAAAGQIIVATSKNEEVAATTKVNEQEKGFGNTRENSHMPDEPTLTVPDFEAKVASMSKELDAEKKARKAAELKFASMKVEFETARKVVDELKAAATEQMAETAAVLLVQEGKATADQVPYFASLYTELGRERFEDLASKLQTTNLGAYAVKAAANVPISPEAVKAHKERMSKLLREA